MLCAASGAVRSTQHEVMMFVLARSRFLVHILLYVEEWSILFYVEFGLDFFCPP